MSGHPWPQRRDGRGPQRSSARTRVATRSLTRGSRAMAGLDSGGGSGGGDSSTSPPELRRSLTQCTVGSMTPFTGWHGFLRSHFAAIKAAGLGSVSVLSAHVKSARGS